MTRFAPSASTPAAGATPNTIEPGGGPALSDTDMAQLKAADTAFLGSRSEAFGTDGTHRGGPPGFISVVDDRTIVMPDYAGNGMFQTLGNLLIDDRVGLLVVDFITGRVVQLTGRGSIEPADDSDPLSLRTLKIGIDEVRSHPADIGSWTDIEAFQRPTG